MVRAILLVGLLSLVACTQRLICPAYQSAFIYDKGALKQKFSYFQQDSTPKVLTASKTKYLIAVPESYRKKYRRLQTIEMKPIYPVIPDSLKVDKGADLILAERDVSDSSNVKPRSIEPTDSTYAITKAKEKFNVDQDNYMWYFRDALVLPDVRAAMSTRKKDNEPKPAATEKKSGGWFGFGKKAKVDEPPKVTQDSTAAPTPKKSINPFRRKTQEPVKPKKTDPAKKEDDGF